MISTNFSELLGNESIKAYLKRMVHKGAIAHSMLFAGLDGIGKSLFAQALAAEIFDKEDPQGHHKHKISSGNHPDLHIYHPEGKLGMHSIESLRQLNEEVYLPAYESSWKVFIIHHADRMLTYSANALLKTFEEPLPKTVIILVSSEPRALLPTILSRCNRKLFFQPLSESLIQNVLKQRFSLEDSLSQNIAHQARGSLARAIELAQRRGDLDYPQLIQTLAKGKLESYRELTDLAQHLAEQVEATKKQFEEEAKEKFFKVPLENLSAQQVNMLEKELEGMVSIRTMEESHAIFNTILTWYRDLHLLYHNSKKEFLFHQHEQANLINILQKGNLIDLKEVYNAIQEACLLLQRSTSLAICLENLFLKLRFL